MADTNQYNPTYHEMEIYLDKYSSEMQLPPECEAAMGFMIQSYHVIKKLMADVQKLQAEVKALTTWPEDW